MDPSDRLDTSEDRSFLPLPGFELQTVQPVSDHATSRSDDCGAPRAAVTLTSSHRYLLLTYVYLRGLWFQPDNASLTCCGLLGTGYVRRTCIR